MDIKDFSNIIKAKKKELDDLMRRRMPVLAGRMAKDHYQDNFRQSGFVNGGLRPWPASKRLSSGGTSASDNYGTLLSSRNHLFSSIKYVPGDGRVVVSNDLQYAPVHNWGGTVSPAVTRKMRGFAWAMYYKTIGKKKGGTDKKKGKRGGSAKAPVSPQAAFWRNLALTKKTKLSVRIPQRQFLGESQELIQKINDKTEEEIRKILNQ
jgi:phage gpG-like protein